MGCLFACFRIKCRDRKENQLFSESLASKNRDPTTTNSQLKNVILCVDSSRCSTLQQNFDREKAGELKNEVELLKSCGVLLETPAEIQIASEKSTIHSETIGNDEIPMNDSGRKLHSDDQIMDLSKRKSERVAEFDEAGKDNPESRGGQIISLEIDNQVKHDTSPSATPKLVIPSLSEWLKPPTSDENSRFKCSNKSPNADRPIIGLVATHWKESEPARLSPKWFDGNGIPNSTNKYKEDQKVRWHATPFEERLEKAISDEKLFPRRGLGGSSSVSLGPEAEEYDTAVSKPPLLA